jgi:magnesium chelatase family protein
MNPCPCGYYGDPKRECRCSPNQIQKYQSKISGPLLDRIDLHVEVPAVQFEDMARKETAESSMHIRNRVMKARERQHQRFKKKDRINAYMGPKGIKVHCALNEECETFLKSAMSEMNFSARSYDRILKVSRTIADLENKPSIETHHLAEALQYRSLDRKLWS